ncbi:MAG: ferrous iron transport protein B, partial [Clostridia bacterium]|nr:ferrous iron transport protein B [Clostridia bacterium]
MIFALVGNQNCGKTTLFNQLTGSNRHVGNFPGVTVDGKMGDVRGIKGASIVDLPGIYSIRPYTNEEIVTRDFILNEKPDGIINIVDATNIERNLYLTLQLLEMHIPMVLALNMMDEVRGNGGTVDVSGMSRELGIPVIPISAAKNEGVDELIDEAVRVAKNRIYPARIDFCRDGAIHRLIHAVSHAIEDHASMAGISARFAATKVIEEDNDLIERLGLDQNEMEMIEHSVIEMEREEGLDRHEAMAAMRYEFIESVTRSTVVKCRESKEHARSAKIDAVLTHRIFAIPIFIGIMLSVFVLTFAVFGNLFAKLIDLGIGALSDLVEGAMASLYVNDVVKSLIIDGIFGGVGSVISFVPYIVVLFFFLSVLEDTGYMARVAFVMDKLLRKIGLSGRSFVPMIIGFGCTVPAVMSARTLSSERDRKMTILLTPFMSCSAKMTIYLFFVNFMFESVWTKVLVMASLYFGGALVGILFALLLNKTAFRGKPVPFVMELPNYRFPSVKSVLLLMWEKAKD